MTATAIPERKLTPDELIQNNMGLVRSVANKISKTTGVEYLELFQEGSIGLVKAARSFDETKNFRFSTYATRCIQNEMLVYLRKGRQTIKCKSLELIPNWHDRAGNYDGDMSLIEVDSNALESMSIKHKRMMLLLSKGLSIRQVAKEMRVTPKAGYNMLYKARAIYEKASGFRF
ncbi:sigma-70 family RNA polymerase sigma factor [Paenibacillus sp. FSL R5-0636]|uniref:sigma-70 family RNA polymerase sigma factor n=1 Tax=Paenibacillus TaxID=44249 RepID=UPI00096E8317|nr:sigma-70 family RNA polymerase sigma factor [Paenibacillus odorifer]OMC99162.1 hypothetical protein BJP49_30000 [Paenibacillus odorifer]